VRWQVQEAKQRFSELLRRAHEEGPQSVTRHGEEVAIVMDIAYYRELTGQTADLRMDLLSMPHGDDIALELEHVRSAEPTRDIEFEVEVEA
jgi:prevent-host-death family protein